MKKLMNQIKKQLNINLVKPQDYIIPKTKSNKINIDKFTSDKSFVKINDLKQVVATKVEQTQNLKQSDTNQKKQVVYVKNTWNGRKYFINIETLKERPNDFVKVPPPQDAQLPPNSYTNQKAKSNSPKNVQQQKKTDAKDKTDKKPIVKNTEEKPTEKQTNSLKNDKKNQLIQQKTQEIMKSFSSPKQFLTTIKQFDKTQYKQKTQKVVDTFSNKQKQIVETYSGKSYIEINEKLRNNNLNSKDKKFIQNLNQTLDKLPSYQGATFRGMGFDNKNDADNFIKQLTSKGSITFDSYCSTSSSQKIAKNYMRKRDSVLFYIKSKTGKGIHDLSFYPQQQQILFKPGTSFKYSGKRGNVIMLQEI